MARSQVVLSLGADDELISLREAVLRTVGLNVFSTTDPEEALGRIRAGTCGVMLVCYSLEQAVRERLAAEFRRHCPDGRIISISNKRADDGTFYGDIVFDALEGAEALIDTVRTQLAYP